MKKAVRIAMGSGILVAGLAVAGAPAASAQVRVRGSFPTPHGRISVDIGHGGFPVGGYVPYGYDVYEDAEYGYGFAYEDQWIACEPRGTRWVIVAAPVFYGHRDYRYGRTYRDYRYGRTYRNDRYGYSRDHRTYRRSDRTYRRDDRRWRDSRTSRRNDRRTGGRDPRW